MAPVTIDPESVRLARAAWDVATPASRIFLLLRSRYAARRGIGHDEADFFSRSWDEIPTETALAVAWDVQFMRRVLGDGHKALKAATSSVGGSVVDGGAAAR
jgi:hypothetical protein